MLEGAAWVQRDGRADALASPWSRHRDALGLRRASFFDPSLLRRSVDLLRLHHACSRGEVPEPPERLPEGLHWDLHGLMRVAAAVHGVMPAHRSSFATFVQASRRCGASRRAVADALQVGPRRVRHYAAVEASGVDAVLTSLTDARLLCVP